MEIELLEQMAEKAHDTWRDEKKRQGFHHPHKCQLYLHSAITQGMSEEEAIEKINLDNPPCTKCHKDMKPYAELSEDVKDFDRQMVLNFGRHLEELGCIVIKEAKH